MYRRGRCRQDKSYEADFDTLRADILQFLMPVRHEQILPFPFDFGILQLEFPLDFNVPIRKPDRFVHLLDAAYAHGDFALRYDFREFH